MDDDLFWASTPSEMARVLNKKAEAARLRQRAAALRAGLVTSAIYNVHRKKGSRRYRPTDFIKTKRRHMSVEEATAYMDRWVREHNKKVEA